MNDRTKYVKCLKTIKSIFNFYDIKFWLDYGTLWGAIRDNAIMEFDNDVDVGVWLEDVSKIPQTKKSFARYGYDLRVNKGHLNYTIHDIKTGEHLGCVLFRKKVEGHAVRIHFYPFVKWLRILNIGNGGLLATLAWKIVIGLHLYTDMEVSAKLEHMGKLKHILFYDYNFLIPEFPEKYLDWMYCNRDWRIKSSAPLHGSEVGRRRQRLKEVLKNE